jgi:hypothetical protein
VLFPGASYEISVDFRAEGRRNAPGHVAQWVLFATVECPAGWKTGDGFPARRARARDDADDADDADVDPRDVRVAGCRAVAVVLRGSRERRLEVASMMLNPETPKFVPKRLREAFDELPRALVSPPAYLLGFVGEPDGAAPEQQTPHGVSRFMRIHPSVVASVCTPAAYLGPDGVLVPRAFFRVTQDGAREGAVPFEDAAQWRFASETVTRWARLLAVEERRQALDIRRYDLHDAVFVFRGAHAPRASRTTLRHVRVGCARLAGGVPPGRAAGRVKAAHHESRRRPRRDDHRVTLHERRGERRRPPRVALR